MSALPPIATAKADMGQMVMSALPPKADMCSAPSDVGYGPEADSRSATKKENHPRNHDPVGVSHMIGVIHTRTSR
jgi:hypothetical protein